MKSFFLGVGVWGALLSSDSSAAGDSLSRNCLRSLAQAEELAWISLISDATDSESPLALIREEGLKDSDLLALIEQAQEENRFSVRLLEAGVSADRGETTDRAFIFQYRIRTLSDHIFTVVVPHECSGAVYNYGFN